MLYPEAIVGGSTAWLSSPRLSSRASQIDYDALGAMIRLWSPDFYDLPRQIDRNLVAYMLRYTGAGLEELDRCTFSRIKNLADGIDEIIQTENKV